MSSNVVLYVCRCPEKPTRIVNQISHPLDFLSDILFSRYSLGSVRISLVDPTCSDSIIIKPASTLTTMR